MARIYRFSSRTPLSRPVAACQSERARHDRHVQAWCDEAWNVTVKGAEMERRNFLRHTGTGAAVLTVGAAAVGLTPQVAAATGEMRSGRPLRVDIVLFDGAEDLDFTAPFETFSQAGSVSPGAVDVRYVTLDGPGLVRTQYGSRIQVDHAWSPAGRDVILVPGGGFVHRDGPGVWSEIDRGVLPRALAAAVRNGLTIASVCTGAMILSAAGLTRGRPCTTHHLAQADLRAQGGLVKTARVVDDGDLVTAGGVSSGLDLGLWLVRRELGAETAVAIESMLEYEARGTVWTPTTP
ncbi:DJ-1/PfpI family protein [Kitasatospora sp. NPDC052896]|uniref:DJ-1/PfpI family protein n=1 Tax=Kitasatospora sp. NPDC052896 TaxID=3364061 RepID=UPI0037C6DBC1